MQQTVKYFVNGHTAKGYVNFLYSNIKNMNNIIILQGGLQQDVTILLSQLLQNNNDIHQDFLCNPEGKDDIGRVLFRDKQVAVLHESIIDYHIENAEFMNLEDYYDPSLHKVNKQEVDKLYNESYALFKKGLEIH